MPSARRWMVNTMRRSPLARLVSRRTLLALSLTLGIFTLLDTSAARAETSAAPVKIGIIGTGRIGALSRGIGSRRVTRFSCHLATLRSSKPSLPN